MTNINLTPVFQALIALLAALITYRVIPWIKSRTTLNQRMELTTAAKIAVFAAEQIYGMNKEANDQKLAYAVAQLEQLGFDLDTIELRNAVEAAVYEFKNRAFLPRFPDFMEELISDEPEDEESEEAEDSSECTDA